MMKSTKFVLVAVACVLAAGCASKQPVIPPAVPITGTVNFNRDLLTECPDLPRAKSSSDNDLKDHSSAVIQLYVACATNKRLENSEVKKAFNIK